MRSRFMRGLASVMLTHDDAGATSVPPGYHNASHFLRDAHRFPGMTPRRFLAMDLPHLRAALLAPAGDRMRQGGGATMRCLVDL